MKFDKIIINPPFNGRGGLYTKIISQAKDNSDVCVSISPITSFISKNNKNFIIKDLEKLNSCVESYDVVSGSSFNNAFFDKKLIISKFSNTISNASFDNLFYEYKNLELIKSKEIYNKFDNYCNNVDNLYNHLIDKNFNRYNYNCYMAGTRGNYDSINDKPLWSWTTLFHPKYKYVFNEYKGKSKELFSIPFNTEYECKNFVDYCDSDILMFSIYLNKISIASDKWLFKCLPYMPTYTKSWTDDEIAKEVGLTKEEVDYIYKEMKDFGYKAQFKK